MSKIFLKVKGYKHILEGIQTLVNKQTTENKLPRLACYSLTHFRFHTNSWASWFADLAVQ